MTKKDDDTRNRLKRHLQNQRAKLPDEEPEKEIIVVHKLDKYTFMPDTGPSQPNLIRDILRAYLRNEVDAEGAKDRLYRIGIDITAERNKLWLRKVILEYFYGSNFAKLLKFIKEA